MIDQLMKGIVDFLYGIGRVKRKYSENNPTEKILATDASKGLVTSGNQDIQQGLNWVTSQRAVLILTDKKLICGKWIIPIYDITNAQLIKINSLFGSGQVLKIQTKDNTNYQFGMQINPEWTSQKVLPLTIENGRVKHSAYSTIVRIIAIGFLVYWLYEKIFR